MSVKKYCDKCGDEMLPDSGLSYIDCSLEGMETRIFLNAMRRVPRARELGTELEKVDLCVECIERMIKEGKVV